MRRLLLAFLVIVLLAEVVSRVVGSSLPGPRYWDSEFSQNKSQRAEALGEVDVAFAGSSIVNSGIDPDQIDLGALGAGAKAYNAGLPDTSPRTWELWVDDVVLPSLCPRVVVFGVSVRDMNDNNADAAARLDRYASSAGRQSLRSTNWGLEIDQRASDLSALVRYRSRFREPVNVLRKVRTGSVAAWPDTELSDSGHFSGRKDLTYRSDAVRDRRLLGGALGDYDVGGVESDALLVAARSAQSTGAAVVILEMPTMHDELAGILPDGEAAFDSVRAEAELVAAATGGVFLSATELDDDPSLFSDHYHLNNAGIAEFAQLVGPLLAGVDVPDRPAVTCAAIDS